MAGSLGVVATTFVARTKPFQQGVNRVQGSVRTFGTQLKANKSSLNSWARRLVIGAAAAVTLRAAVRMVMDSLREMDETAKQASRLGMLPARLIELQYAADLSGFGADRLGNALEKMNMRLAEASFGTGEAVQVLNDLGLSAEQLMTLAPDEAFRKLSEAIGKVKNPADQARVAYKMFEEQGVQMLNLLKVSKAEFEAMRAELLEFAPALAAINFDNAEEIQDQITRTRYKFKLLKMTLAIALKPVIDIVIGALMSMVNWLVENRLMIVAVIKRIGAFIGWLWKWRKVILVIVVTIGVLVVALQAYAIAMAIAQSLSGPVGWAMLAAGAALAVASVLVINSQFASISNEVEKMKEAEKEAAAAGAQKTKQLKQQQQLLAVQMKQAQAIAKLMEEGANITKEMRTPQEVFGDRINQLSGLLRAGAITWETYGRAIGKAADDLDRATEQQSKFNEKQKGKAIGTVTRGTVAAFSASQAANREFTRMRRLQEHENDMAQKRNDLLDRIRQKIDAPPAVAGI